MMYPLREDGLKWEHGVTSMEIGRGNGGVRLLNQRKPGVLLLMQNSGFALPVGLPYYGYGRNFMNFPVTRTVKSFW